MKKILTEIIQQSDKINNHPLTEADCHYFVRTILNNFLLKTKIIEDHNHCIQIETPVIHSELSWYDKNSSNRKLSIRPDLTIINYKNIKLYNQNNKFSIPSKGYSFDGDAINFEIKFIRRNSSFTNKIKKDIEKDKINSKILFNRFIESGTKVWTYILLFIWSDRGILQAGTDKAIIDLLSDDEGFSFIKIIKK